MKKQKYTIDQICRAVNESGSVRSASEILGMNLEEIMRVINKFVVPFYEVAINNLKNTGQNYYWEENK